MVNGVYNIQIASNITPGTVDSGGVIKASLIASNKGNRGHSQRPGGNLRIFPHFSSGGVTLVTISSWAGPFGAVSEALRPSCQARFASNAKLRSAYSWNSALVFSSRCSNQTKGIKRVHFKKMKCQCVAQAQLTLFSPHLKGASELFSPSILIPGCTLYKELLATPETSRWRLRHFTIYCPYTEYS